MSEYHKPVLLDEAVSALNIKEGGIYVDVTFGGGGHSNEILSKLDSTSRLIVMDRDKDAIVNIPNDDRVQFIHSNFRYLRRMLRVEGVNQVDGILADFGVSSFQFDTASRGFSTRFDGPLDMRMNADQEWSAVEVINSYTEEELVRIFSEYGEVRNAKTLASRLVEARKTHRILTTDSLVRVIEPVIRGLKQKYLAQVFQALRIEVNQELESIADFLEDAAEVLKPGGKLAIITFHSLEDRLVKNFIKWGNVEGHVIKDEWGNVLKPLSADAKKPIVPTPEEIRSNSRARSAKLRSAIK